MVYCHSNRYYCAPEIVAFDIPLQIPLYLSQPYWSDQATCLHWPRSTSFSMQCSPSRPARGYWAFWNKILWRLPWFRILGRCARIKVRGGLAMVAIRALVRLQIGESISFSSHWALNHPCRSIHRLQWFVTYTVLQDPKSHLVSDSALVGIANEPNV